MKKLLLTISLFVLSMSVFSQNIDTYAERVKELCAPEMWGRSHYEQGSIKAGDYIISELKKNKGITIEKQLFSYPMNVQRGDLEFAVDGKALKPVTEFIVREFSTGLYGEFEVVYLEDKYYDSELFMDYVNSGEFKDKFVVMDFKRFFGKLDDRAISGLEVYNKYVEHMDKVGGMILTYGQLPKYFKARAHYTVPFPVVCVGPEFPSDAKKIEIALDSEFMPKYTAENIFATIKGKSSDQHYMFTAHYDHLEMMGRDNIYLGANDNASGVSFMMTLADYYSLPENQPEYDMVFFFCDGEEGNLLGSKYYAEQEPLRPLSEIKFLINFDMLADNGTDLFVEISDVSIAELQQFREINERESLFGKIERHPLTDNSDHFYFAIRGVPCIYYNVYGDYYKYYHTPSDTFENFTTENFENFFKLTTLFIKEQR